MLVLLAQPSDWLSASMDWLPGEAGLEESGSEESFVGGGVDVVTGDQLIFRGLAELN